MINLDEIRAALEAGAAAIDILVRSLSEPQRRLLMRLRPAGPAEPDGQNFTYSVQTRGVGLDTCAALAKRGIMVGGSGYNYQSRAIGYARLTPLGLRVRDIVIQEARNGPRA